MDTPILAELDMTLKQVNPPFFFRPQRGEEVAGRVGEARGEEGAGRGGETCVCVRMFMYVCMSCMYFV